MSGVLQTLVAASFGWFLASSLWVFPHSLSYFNESIGGPLHGPRHLLGSCVDWGQDLRYLIWSLSEAERSSVPNSRRLAFTALYNPCDLGFPPCGQMPDEYSNAMEAVRSNSEDQGAAAVAGLPEGVYWASVSFEHGVRNLIRPNGSNDASAQYSSAKPHDSADSIDKTFLHFKRAAYSISKVVVK
jgi:hypothetical protein